MNYVKNLYILRRLEFAQHEKIRFSCFLGLIDTLRHAVNTARTISHSSKISDNITSTVGRCGTGILLIFVLIDALNSVS